MKCLATLLLVLNQRFCGSTSLKTLTVDRVELGAGAQRVAQLCRYLHRLECLERNG